MSAKIWATAFEQQVYRNYSMTDAITFTEFDSLPPCCTIEICLLSIVSLLDHEYSVENTEFITIYIICLIEQVKCKANLIVTPMNAFSLIVMGAIMFDKFFSDFPRSNSSWKKILQCDSKEILRQQLRFMFYLDYDVRMQMSSMDDVRMRLQNDLTYISDINMVNMVSYDEDTDEELELIHSQLFQSQMSFIVCEEDMSDM